MTLHPGQTAPDFEQDTTNGSIRFHQWLGGSWCVLFSYSADDTASAAEAARLKPEWSRRGVKVIGLSTGSSDDLASRQREVARTQGFAPNYPVIADADRTVSALYGTLRHPAARHAFLIDGNKTVRLICTYAAAEGCDFSDILRAVDDQQATPARVDGQLRDGARAESGFQSLLVS